MASFYLRTISNLSLLVQWLAKTVIRINTLANRKRTIIHPKAIVVNMWGQCHKRHQLTKCNLQVGILRFLLIFPSQVWIFKCVSSNWKLQLKPTYWLKNSYSGFRRFINCNTSWTCPSNNVPTTFPFLQPSLLLSLQAYERKRYRYVTWRARSRHVAIDDFVA